MHSSRKAEFLKHFSAFGPQIILLIEFEGKPREIRDFISLAFQKQALFLALGKKSQKHYQETLFRLLQYLSLVRLAGDIRIHFIV